MSTTQWIIDSAHSEVKIHGDFYSDQVRLIFSIYSY